MGAVRRQDVPDAANVPVHDGTIVYDNLPHIQYSVSGLTPLGWFAAPNGMKRVSLYSYTKDDTTGIENYPLEGKSGEEVRAIIERLAYVGVESDRIIASLPEEFEMDVELEPSGLDRYAKAAV